MAGSRILVVDDDDDIRGLVRTLLERAGHEVSDAADGREGLRELYAGSPDLVILDVAMPVLDGIEATKRIVSGAAPLDGELARACGARIGCGPKRRCDTVCEPDFFES